jgi:sulfate adenylyltransferase subunit 2
LEAVESNAVQHFGERQRQPPHHFRLYISGPEVKIASIEWATTIQQYCGCRREFAKTMSHLDILEAESIYILREVVAEFSRPAMLYSIGKDSSVMLRLAEKAFFPGKVPFPLLHVDTTYKFREMIEFRDETCRRLGLQLIVHTNVDAIADGASPFRLGPSQCCGLLKTKALLDALKAGRIDAAIGGARREEEKSRAKERVFSLRDAHGQWDPKNQRPEVWNLYNSRLEGHQTIRIFPLSNWTELDIWQYIEREGIPVVPLYFAKERRVLVRGDILIPLEHDIEVLPNERSQLVLCRMRSLGCTYCTGAIRSSADTVPKIIQELRTVRRSERENRIIDHDQEGSMELKKREGYF